MALEVMEKSDSDKLAMKKVIVTVFVVFITMLAVIKIMLPNLNHSINQENIEHLQAILSPVLMLEVGFLTLLVNRISFGQLLFRAFAASLIASIVVGLAAGFIL